jgi:hypothetical protein
VRGRTAGPDSSHFFTSWQLSKTPNLPGRGAMNSTKAGALSADGDLALMKRLSLAPSRWTATYFRYQPAFDERRETGAGRSR